MTKEYKTTFWAGVLFLLVVHPLQAQIGELELDLQAETTFSEAQVINFMSLAFDESGRGPGIFSLVLQNTTTRKVSDVYLEYTVSSTRSGLIFESKQDPSTPFSIEPGQLILANNNDLASAKLRGISHPVYFSGQLTSSGRELLNRLQGGSSLPPDAYTLTMNVYDQGTGSTGGRLLTSSSISIGENLYNDDFSLYLLGPGDLPGSGITISNPYPEFRWEGLPNQRYRVVVVKDVEGESPASLIESALSTDPARENSMAGLLQFEHMDMVVNGTRFQFPFSGTQPLVPGETYYWQVFATLETTAGEELLSSEIWSFTLENPASAQTNISDEITIESDSELFILLSALLGEAKAAELVDNDFRLESIEMDEVDYRGVSARTQLEQLLQKVREGTVKFTNRP